MKTVKGTVSKLLPIGEMMSDRVFNQSFDCLIDTMSIKPQLQVRRQIVNELDDEID